VPEEEREREYRQDQVRAGPLRNQVADLFLGKTWVGKNGTPPGTSLFPGRKRQASLDFQRKTEVRDFSGDPRESNFPPSTSHMRRTTIFPNGWEPAWWPQTRDTAKQGEAE